MGELVHRNWPTRRNRNRLTAALEAYREREFDPDRFVPLAVVKELADAAELVLYDTNPRMTLINWEQADREQSSSTSTPTPDERCFRSS